MRIFTHKVEFRNTWRTGFSGLDWLEVLHGGVDFNQSMEHMISECDISVSLDSNALDETDNNNVLRMYSECKITEITEDGSVIRFHGLIDGPHGDENQVGIHLQDPLGSYKDCIYNGTLRWEADTVKLGSSATGLQVSLIPVTESGETRYIPDFADPAWDTLFTGGTPDGTGSNRRTWKAFGRVIDDGTQDGDPDAAYYFVDQVIPPGLYTIGTDLLNYIEFTGHTPQGNITVDFIIAYVEGTNELEDIIQDIFEISLSDGGLGFVDGVHFQTQTGAIDYEDQTIWPSLITVNEFIWREEDGSLLEALEFILENFAPPNYRIFWWHRKMMAYCGFVEVTPHQTNTPYYLEGSYAFGGIEGVDVTPPFTNAFVKALPIESREFPRDGLTFASKVIVEGVNEWPGNLATALNMTVISEADGGVPISGSWVEVGDIANLVDMSMHTDHKFEIDGTNPSEAEQNTYWPYLFIDFGVSTNIDIARFIALNSQREFSFGLRVEVCNDSGATYDPDASWEPAHKDFFGRLMKPYEEVRIEEGWMKDYFRNVKISILPAKTGDSKKWALGLTDLQFIERQIVTGYAEIIGGAGTVGTFTQVVGTGINDGYYTLLMPNLFTQLFSRSFFANKVVRGHKTAYFRNHSLANTNQCAYEAAKILAETVRDQRVAGIVIVSNIDLELYKTVQVVDPVWGVTLKCMIENISVNNYKMTLDLNSFSLTAWTGETPGAI